MADRGRAPRHAAAVREETRKQAVPGREHGGARASSDVCAVPAAGIVAEAMVALVLADAVAEKFGGDSVTETRRNVTSYLENLAVR
ncbi:Chorismate synthase [Streptomyces griseomycini]